MERLIIASIALTIYVFYLIIKAIYKKIKKTYNKWDASKYDVPYREMEHPGGTGKKINLEYDESMKKAGVFEDDKIEKSHIKEDTISDYEYFSQDSQKDTSSAVYCPSCGTRDWDNNVFCKKCGARLREDKEETHSDTDRYDKEETYTVFYNE